MDILNVLKQLRDDIKTWVTTNFNALNAKIDEKTIPIDSELSSTSTNPVQNKTITNAINNIPRFSGDYNDLTNAPNIAEDDSGEINVTDEAGNIIFKVDADGIHTTAVSLNGEAAATEKYVDDAVANIPTPDVSGQINAHNINTEAHADIRQAIEDAKEELSESIVAESDEWKVVDNNGNIIFSVDAEGAHTTELTLNGETAATETYVDNAIANIDIPEVDFTGYATEKYVDEAIAAIPEADFTGYATEDFVTNSVNSAKEELSESIVAESDEWKVVDEAENVIFSVDATGAHTTELTLNGESAATESYVDDAIANIEFPTTDLTDYATKKYVDDAVDSVDFTGYATETYVDNKVADLVNSAPEALNTLGELATALENHEDAYDALLETVGGKATQEDLNDLKEELSESIVSESDEWKVVDENGNIIFSVDADGAHTTSMTLNGQPVEDMIDNKVDKVDGKGLSTNDFTDEYKRKLDNINEGGGGIVAEEDPTVPAWAKEPTKPSYTAEEVGALPEDTPLFSGDYNDLINAPEPTDLSDYYTKGEVDEIIEELGDAADYLKKAEAVGYNDILTKTEAPNLYQAKGEYASKAQGEKANSALQEVEVGEGLKVSAKANNKQKIEIDTDVIFVLNANF